MFLWVLDTPLIFKRLRGKLSRSLFYDKINSKLNHSPRCTCSFSNIYMSHLFTCISYFFRLFLFPWILELERAPLSSVLRYQIRFTCWNIVRNIAQNLHVKNVTQTSLIKMLFLKGILISIFKVQKVIYWSYYFDNLNFMKEK